MNALKKLLILTTFLASIALSNQKADAAECTSAGGCGYAECVRAPSLIPAIALGTIALVAIVAVAVQNQSHGDHGHD